MIINLYVEKEKTDDYWSDRVFKFVDETRNEIIAEGVHGILSKTPTTLKYKENEYVFKNSPTKNDRINLNTIYPLSSKRKWCLGYYVENDAEQTIFHYQDAITCGKKWIFKKNIVLDVLKINDKHYKIYKIGFNEPCHYYCIHDENNETIAVIKRIYGNDITAKIYVENEKYLLESLLTSTLKMIWLIYVDAEQHIRDKSSGNYISILNEEKLMFDKTFVEKMKK